VALLQRSDELLVAFSVMFLICSDFISVFNCGIWFPHLRPGTKEPRLQENGRGNSRSRAEGNRVTRVASGATVCSGWPFVQFVSSFKEERSSMMET